MKIKSILLIWLLLSAISTTYPNPNPNPRETLDSIFHVLKYVESNNNADEVGDDGKAYGIVQIHAICVEDVNRIYGTDYTHEDAFQEDCAREIFFLYLSKGIKRFRVKYNREPTNADLVRMWNGSIYTGYRKESTKKYYRKYLKHKLTMLEHGNN